MKSAASSAASSMARYFKHNEKWAASHAPSFFAELAKAQSPRMLYIGCADSRLPAEEFMGAAPGEVFVHRNIANMVINTDLSAQSVINFAVMHLKVREIVVCGHYGCGGVRAAIESRDLGLLNPWLRCIRDVYRLHRRELMSIDDEDARYRRLVELNVQEQCVNVLKTADVQKAYRAGDLSVHGWIFDLHNGRLVDLNVDIDEIMERIMEIYRLD